MKVAMLTVLACIFTTLGSWQEPVNVPPPLVLKTDRPPNISRPPRLRTPLPIEERKNAGRAVLGVLFIGHLL